MSSTEQKNLTDGFIAHCKMFGVYPTILCGAFDDFALDTHRKPFEALGSTRNLGERLRQDPDAYNTVVQLFPVLRDCPEFTRSSPLILKLCSDSHVYTGNQAVLRFGHSVAVRRGGMHFKETPGNKHARTNVSRIASLLAPGSYSNFERTSRNIETIRYKELSGFLRTASDAVDKANRSGSSFKYRSETRYWCRSVRSQLDLPYCFRKKADAKRVYTAFNPNDIEAIPEPPEYKQKWVKSKKSGCFRLKYYRFGSYHYIKLDYPKSAAYGSQLIQTDPSDPEKKVRLRQVTYSELYILSSRDMDDLQFILHAMANMVLYFRRRTMDVYSNRSRAHLAGIHQVMWGHYLKVMFMCGKLSKFRNKLGVYFDVLQWRYLAELSGNEFVNHGEIMGKKVISKGLEGLPDQQHLLEILYKLPKDMAIDILGMYKASIYPEVDPYKVVADQYDLHMSRFDTDWPEGSAEAQRFQDTKAYMWYFGIRVVRQRYDHWPGKIRSGVVEKEWHKTYKRDGIPASQWRDAYDVDLTGGIPVSDISNEQYMRQQDSACAPAKKCYFESFMAMRQAPRKQKRKLLYTIQEEKLPDLPNTLEYLNSLGLQLPAGHIDPIDYHLDFSTDIVTGSRCERHKDAPRPFYAASSPWGCILSYIDGITRDFLSNVPQSMLGKSTRQKYMDLSTAARATSLGTQAFYMSDDKAKYSPRMDPRSQQLPADFFAELFDIPAIRAVGPIMYHNTLYYRVCGHLVSYCSNGTDREGMRGASNTWLEIVAQGLSTRLSREKGYIRGKSLFLSFIDDGLRRFAVDTRDKTEEQIKQHAQFVINDVIFGLKVLGRELSWDKTFISRDLFVILNEIMYDGSHLSSGLKSFVTTGDIEVKQVMSASDYEGLYFGKFRGAHGVGAPLDICHYAYIYEVLLSHYKMGVRLQDNHQTGLFEYRMYCVTPIALGGGGIRSMIQMGCNEVAGATKEGMGVLMRLAIDKPIFRPCVHSILSQELEPLSPMDFMREPEQFHVAGPRIRTQRLAGVVRKHLSSIAKNDMSRKFVMEDATSMEFLCGIGKLMMAIGDTSAEEIRLLYSSTPVAFIDEFIQKLAASSTLAEILGKEELARVRRAVRMDLIRSVNYFRVRCGAEEFFTGGDVEFLSQLSFLVM